MQMKMDKKLLQKFDKQQVRRILEFENEFISTLFDSFEVPDSIEDKTIDDQYLLKTMEKVGKLKPNARKSKKSTEDGQSSVDLEQRLEIIRNKMQSKKTKPSARAIEKKRQKKLKKSKELKKKLISVAKSIKNEKIKEGKSANTSFAEADSNGVDVKPDIKPDIKPAKVFNEEGKMVFSKFEFAAQASRAKKTKKDKTIKDPKLLLKKLKKEKEQINELVLQGEVDKAEELKKSIAWQKAFDKTEGKKVKDNVSLLHKTLHRKKVDKKKSKEQWKEREKKLEEKKEGKAKKREENINKKKDEKKKHKLKKAAKRGRIIAGY
ncbi:surfeit locus protein 6 homolog [Sitodiplosis mosellana]|uniref:surfeit locus protein 6 homolog n=1 Tax=Sitodiplosis mosellana TaxID=263140 RepID=UPI002444651A|nr:surfeit locus protein 6 homolog [Sitodiplosis mosellana]